MARIRESQPGELLHCGSVRSEQVVNGACSFAFQAKFLPGGAHLWHDSRLGKELQATDNDVKRQTDQWIKALREDKTVVPYRHDDGTVEPDERRSTGDLRR